MKKVCKCHAFCVSGQKEEHTDVSGRNPIDGTGHPVTIGIHISTEISKISYSEDLKC